MRIKKNIIYVVVPILLIFCAIVTHRYRRNKELSRQRIQRQNSYVSVTAASVDYHTFRNTVSFTGNILATKRADIRAEIMGRVISTSVCEGDYVKRGAILANLAGDDLMISVQSAEANLSIAKIKAKQAKVDNDRAQKLLRDSSVSYQYAQQLETIYHSALISVRAAESGLHLAKSYLRKLNIVAPFSGEIVQRFVQAGELLMPGQIAFNLVDNSRLELQVDLSADAVTKIKVGMKASFQVAGLNQSFNAVVRRVCSSIRRESRTVTVVLDINNDGHCLRNGMFAEGSIFINEGESKLALPSSVLNAVGNEAEVFIIDNRSIACMRKILVGVEQDGWRPVYGIDINTKVIANNSSTIADGTLVRITNTMIFNNMGQ